MADPLGDQRTEWLARAGVLVTGLLLIWYTWAHWGNVQIDCGRELYVPLEILKGRLLYRDLWYPYGPLAPYVQAAFLLIFGASLTSLYFLGLGLTLTTALLVFALSRRFVPVEPALVIALFVLLQAVHPGFFNYLFPYSTAAVIGQLLGLTCLYLCIGRGSDERKAGFLFAGLAAGFALLCKQEFGAASFLLIGFAILLRVPKHRSIRAFTLEVVSCAPGLVLGAIVYGWLVYRLSARFMLMENLESTPGSYFMRTYGTYWVRVVGMRLDWNETRRLFWIDVVVLAAWCSFAYSLRYLVQRRWLAMLVGVGATLLIVNLDVLSAFLRVGTNVLVSTRLALVYFALPLGVFWLGCAMWVRACVRWLNGCRDGRNWAIALLATYALAIGSRVLAQVGPFGYGIFYDIGLLLVFVILQVEIVGRAAAGLGEPRRSIMLKLAFGSQALLVALTVWNSPGLQPARLETDLGTIYAQPAEARLYPKVVSFMKAQSHLGKHILVLPEAPLLYALSGTEAPTRWYEITPGLLSPEDEREFIRQAEESGVDTILLSNRFTGEYGVPYFGQDYCREIGAWIDTHYRLTGQIGDFRREPTAPFAMLLYQRRTAPAPASQAPKTALYRRLGAHRRSDRGLRGWRAGVSVSLRVRISVVMK
jgi:hypothetical protein